MILLEDLQLLEDLEMLEDLDTGTTGNPLCGYMAVNVQEPRKSVISEEA